MWYRALLSVEQLAAGCVAAIRSQFAIAVQSAGEPSGACLFVTSHEIPDATEPSDSAAASAEDAVVLLTGVRACRARDDRPLQRGTEPASGSGPRGAAGRRAVELGPLAAQHALNIFASR